MAIHPLIQDGKWQSGLYSHDPHNFLGLHQVNDQEKVIRLWRPQAEEVYLEVKGAIVSAEKIGYGGIFEVKVPSSLTALDYRIYHQNGLLAHDPYAFSPTFGEMDGYLFSKGVHYKLYEVLGARLCSHQEVKGVKFAVWAPFAREVSIVGDFNRWDGRVNPMRTMGASGVWELFIPGLQEREKYKFEIQTQDHQRLFKSDPMAYGGERRPSNASLVIDVDAHVWQDSAWMKKREKRDLNIPINIYEVHLGSWDKKEEFPNYKDMAHALANYCKEMAFTHVELLPLAEHPLDESWGYQISGFYAVTSRYGTPSDFQYFVDHLHQEGIGVIIDWVPAHFPVDDFALSLFDGTCLYEHKDPKQGYHPHWSTNIFNYARFEVSNFLLANALFWFDKMHIDGLRVDAVASMLYLDYGREEGGWIPNIYGGRENLAALEFIKHVNSVVHDLFPRVLMIAEESTSFYGVTRQLEWGGLGFDLKWNMGWMNDTLSYFKTDPLFRVHDHNKLTFGLCYAFSERFMLPLSHDEVVHGKSSLLSKMPGDNWQKFANLRLLYSYMMCQPGKKLFFMGGEIAQWSEWNCKASLDWSLLDYPLHKGMQRMVKELNIFYQTHPSLWEKDFDPEGFSWVDCLDRKNSILSYLRKGEFKVLLCIHNFTAAYFEHYEVRLENVMDLQEVFSSDREEYGGSGKVNGSIILQKHNIILQVAPLATMIFEVTFAH
ncbi:MAG: 1,4-alpha-glucan branching protein GlgB [Chlamydiota bacterium]